MSFTLRDAHEIHRGNHEEASKIMRQLGFAGVAIVWIFRTPEMGIPQGLSAPLFLIVIALACDLFQYLWHSLAWHYFIRKHHKNNALPEDVFEYPTSIDYPAHILWLLKMILISISYVLIATHLTRHVDWL